MSARDVFAAGRTLFAFSSRYSRGLDPKHIPSKIIECDPLGPLSPYIDYYVGLLNEEGYAPASVRDHVRVIVRFSRSHFSAYLPRIMESISSAGQSLRVGIVGANTPIG